MTGMVAGQIPIAASATSVTSSIANGQLPATGTNDNAATGKLGEYLTAVQSTAVSITTTTATDIVSLSLTAGDWDVEGSVNFTGNTMTTVLAALSLTSATLPSTPAIGGYNQIGPFISGSVSNAVLPTGALRVSLAAPATVYLEAFAIFTLAGSTSGRGALRARRAR
jgi:hypothetical protein